VSSVRSPNEATFFSYRDITRAAARRRSRRAQPRAVRVLNGVVADIFKITKIPRIIKNYIVFSILYGYYT